MSQAVADQLFLAYMGRAADTQWRNNTSTLTTNMGDQPTKALKDAFYSAGVAEGVYAAADSPSTLVNKFFLNTFGFAARTDEQTFWGNLLANGTYSAGELVWQMFSSYANNTSVLPTTYVVPMQSKLMAIDAFSNALTDPTINAAYSQLNSTAATAGRTYLSAVTSQATAATAMTGVAATVATVSSVSSGTTFTLTINADTGASFTGNSSSNTFDASGFFNAATATTLQTLGNGDSIDGGQGTDTLNVALNTATATTRPAALTSIEVINLTNTVGTNILDLANATGVTTLNSVNSATQIAQFDNVQSAPTAFGLTNTAVGLTANILNTALAGTTDAATLTLNGVTAGTVTLQTITAASGYETLNIVSNGSTANVLTAVTDGNGTSLATINVSGAAAINLGTTLDATVLTVNAATLTGILTVVQTNAVKTTITGGTANDIIDVSGAFVDLTDTTNADVINGGGGTDTLILAYAEGVAVGSAAQFANVTNIETIRFDTATAAAGINGTFFTGVTTFEFRNGLGNALSHTLASGQEIQYDTADNGTDTQSFTVAGTSTTDSMTIDINGVDMGAGQQTYIGIETLNIATSGTAVMDGAHVMTATAATETMNISGTGALLLGAVTADVINVTMTAGTLTLGTLAQVTNVNGSGSDAVITVVGSTAADILTGGTGADFLANRVTGAAATAGDIMTGGAGFDTFTLIGVSASTTNYSGSPTISDFTVGTSATDTDLIRFGTADTDYFDDAGAAGLGVVGTADGATGAVVVQTVAQSAGAAAGATGANFIKLTTGVAFTTSLQNTFNAAIGTSTVTTMGADVQVAGSYYDTTNSLMVLFVVDAGFAGSTTTAIETGDAVALIGTISMTAAQYALIDADNFAAFV